MFLRVALRWSDLRGSCLCSCCCAGYSSLDFRHYGFPTYRISAPRPGLASTILLNTESNFRILNLTHHLHITQLCLAANGAWSHCFPYTSVELARVSAVLDPTRESSHFSDPSSLMSNYYSFIGYATTRSSKEEFLISLSKIHRKYYSKLHNSLCRSWRLLRQSFAVFALLFLSSTI